MEGFYFAEYKHKDEEDGIEILLVNPYFGSVHLFMYSVCEDGTYIPRFQEYHLSEQELDPDRLTPLKKTIPMLDWNPFAVLN